MNRMYCSDGGDPLPPEPPPPPPPRTSVHTCFDRCMCAIILKEIHGIIFEEIYTSRNFYKNSRD